MLGADALVFDNKLWDGRDIGDNSQFWQEAKIIKVYTTDNGDEVADVRFHYSGRISKGHFTKNMIIF